MGIIFRLHFEGSTYLILSCGLVIKARFVYGYSSVTSIQDIVTNYQEDTFLLKIMADKMVRLIQLL